MQAFKLKIELKQHTPLIHFQPNEKGATLRASEVKPRLDRFIIEKEGEGEYEQVKKNVKKQHESWFIPKDEVYALNYKMIIEAENVDMKEIEGYFGVNKKGNPLPAPMFFGNMQNNENKEIFIKKQFSTCEKLSLTIISYDESLDKCINKHIEEFFLCSNFGSRQSKGYGSFTKDNISIINDTLKYPYFTVSGNETKLFQEMDLFYKAIRSGINQCWEPKFYMKSLMFAYAKQKGKQWEKKTIKSVIYKDIINKKELNKHPNSDLLTYTASDQYIFKDCLGLSKTENWLKPYINQESRLQYDRKNKITINKRSNKDPEEPEDIQRMKSPITLKPIKISDAKYRVYVVYQDINKEILGKKFYISTNCNKELELNIFPYFSVEEYIRFIIDCNITDLILEGKETQTAKTIIRIFDNLKKNKFYSTSNHE